VSVVSESEDLVMFVRVDGKVSARNISDWEKIVQSWKDRIRN